jgi:hypothetical protein
MGGQAASLTQVVYNRGMRHWLAGVALILCGSTAASAGSVSVTIDSPQAQEFSARSGVDIATLERQLQTELERVFQVLQLNDYLRSFADAQSFTSHGVGVDYASQIRYLMVGFAGNVAVNADKAAVEGEQPSGKPAVGLAANLTFMAGTNLGWLGLPQLSVFANFFNGHLNQGPFAGDIKNFGVHAQYRLFAPPHDESIGSFFVRWGGIAITTGFDTSRMTLKLGSKPINTRVPIDNGAQQEVADVLVNSTGAFALDMKQVSVPLELTTSLRFLWVLSLYGGLGFDWQLGGSSEMNVNLNGTLTGHYQESAFDLGTATVVATDEAKPSPGRMRGLAGIQANLWFLKIFGQVNAMPDPDTVSLAFGARAVW